MNRSGERIRRSGFPTRLQAFLLLCLLTLSTPLLAAEKSHQIRLTDEERAWLANHPVIRVGPDPDYKPIEFFTPDGDYQGLAADYLKLLSERLKIKFQIVRSDNWDTVVEQAKQRDIDMWSAASPTQQRLEYMDFTRPLVTFPAVILVRNGVAQDLTPGDLRGLKVAVVSGYAIHDYMLAKYPGLQLDPTPDVQTALRKVSFGMVDAMVSDLATSTYYMEQEGITNLRIAGNVDYTYQLAFAVRNDWSPLRAILDKGLAALEPDIHKEIFSRWIRVTQQGWKPDLPFYLWLFLFLLTLSVGGGFIWNRTLKRVVVQRTQQLNRELQERKKTEAALVIRDRAIAAASNGIAIVDPSRPDNPLVYVNAAFQRISGYSHDDLLGHGCPFLDDAPENREAVALIRDAINLGLECRAELYSKRPDGSCYWNEVFLSPVHDGEGKLIHFVSINNDITQNKKSQEVVSDIAMGVSAATGEDFFEQLVSHLGEALGVSYVLIGQLANGSEEEINTLAVWALGERAENFTYSLHDTPCGGAIQGGPCAFQGDLQTRFPKDRLLQQMAAESYVGLPLKSSDGRALGLLAALDVKPLENTGYIMSMLTIFAARVSAELERQHADQALRTSEEHYRVLFESANDGILTMEDGLFTSCNHKVEEIFGCPKSEIIGYSPMKFSPPMQPSGADSSRLAQTHIATALAGTPQLFEWLHQRLDGTPVYTEVSLNRIYHEGSMVLTARVRDISERKLREEEVRLAASVFNGTTEAIVITDARGVILQVNRAFSDITGFTPEEAIGKTPRILRSNYHNDAFYQTFWDNLTRAGGWQGEIWNRRKNGEAHPVWQNISAIRDAAGDIVQYISIFSDITDKKLSEQRIEHLAHYDVLTDLPNRVLFTERCEHALSRARREGHQLVVMFLDLDRFKHINDSLGHPVGDRLLQQVADRLIKLIREEDTVARLGGDEFVVVLEDVTDTHVVAPIAEKLLKAFNEPFNLDENQLHISSSIGIAIFPTDGQDVTTLVRNADAAMYRAKESGRNNYQFYTREMTVSANERVLLENSLRQAVEQQQLVLHYHPQYVLDGGQLVGYETLVRWQHPEMGLVAPDRFIPLAEETGVILALGEWVLRKACFQAKAWLDAGYQFGSVAVNVSGSQIERGNIVDLVKQVLWETHLPAHLLELEITENFIIQHAEQAISTLDGLRDIGVSLAIDDFGTGYSSLSYLKRLPINKLKIDRSFVHDIPDGKFDTAITRAVIALGKGLSLRVIAEGVETPSQRDFLLAEGCHEAQGFLYTEPLPAEEFVVKMRASSSAGATQNG
ncbi:EAL domain-containing protein [Sedimenticola sp.]|uniref:EAL domain-containing protein n=1 Tax=Sedimenticola sp. TaxID=1940285 RepID=UPI003D10420E